MLYEKVNKTSVCKTCGEPSCEFYIIDKGVMREICGECKSKIDLIVKMVRKKLLKETRADERKRRES